jgi:hypothetical protein
MPSSIAEDTLQRAANPKDTYCGWCKHPGKRIRKAGLCNHCYRLKLEATRCERKLATFTPRRDPSVSSVDRYMLERALKVAKKMVELAKHEGEYYARFTDPASGLDIEMELSFICKGWLGKDLFYDWANTFDWSFDETQKRLLLYIFRKMIIENLRERRREIAEGIIFREEREAGIA